MVRVAALHKRLRKYNNEVSSGLFTQIIYRDYYQIVPYPVYEISLDE